MRLVEYKGLRFALPTEDVLFHKKLSNYVNELPNGLEKIGYQKRGTLVSVGACFGATVIAALKLAGFSGVIAFEPNQYNCKLLLENLKLNDLVDKVEIVSCAAGARAGSAKMTECSQANIGGHLVHQGEDARGTKEVVVVSVDEILQELRIPVKEVGAVWCDAQGSEPFVLAGAKSLLTGEIPWGIELAPGLLKTPPEAYLEPLQVFDTVLDLRVGREDTIHALPAIYEHYQHTKSPNNPNKSWHTQLLLYRRYTDGKN